MSWQHLRRDGARLASADRLWSAQICRLAGRYRSLYRGSTVLAHAGDGLVWLAIGVLVLAVGSPGDKRILLQVTVSALLAAGCVAALKHGVRRTRPEGAISARWSALPQHDLYSFPSGHAARAACIAVGISSFYPLVGLPLAVWALGVCLARVALAAHYLLDVAAGLALGVGAAMLVGRLWPALPSLG